MLLHHRFQVLEQLAQGGFGATFLAEDTHMPSHRKCVVKRFQPEAPNQQSYDIALEHFQTEAALLEQLRHNQIPQLYGYFEEEGRFYLVQEWIDGFTLGQKVRERGPLPEQKVQQILWNLLPVLSYLHSHKVIHRDIKPENILLRSQDQQPILIDFGSVKQNLRTVIHASGGVTCSIVIGSGGFMPPEQAAQRVVYSSDLYSLGMTIVYLLTGKLPQAIEKDPHTSQLYWQQYATGVSSQLSAVVDKAIQFNPADRFHTAVEMLQAMETSASLPPTRASTQSTAQEAPTLVDPVPLTIEPQRFNQAPTAVSHGVQTFNQAPTTVGQGPITANQASVPLREIGSFAGHLRIPKPTMVAGLLAIFSAGALGSYLLTQLGRGPHEEALTATEVQEVVRDQSILSTADQMRSNGNLTGAMAKLMDVPSDSQVAADAWQKLAQWSHVKLGSRIDDELKPLNLEGRQRTLKTLGVSSLAEVDAKTQQNPIQTKLGKSHIDTQFENWPDYEQPSAAERAANASWDDPWREAYTIVPQKMTLGYIYGCRSKEVLQTEAIFDPAVDGELMQAKLNQMLAGSSPADLEVAQQKLKLVQTGKASHPNFSPEFTTDHHRGWIMRTDQDQVLIAVRKA